MRKTLPNKPHVFKIGDRGYHEHRPDECGTIIELNNQHEFWGTVAIEWEDKTVRGAKRPKHK